MLTQQCNKLLSKPNRISAVLNHTVGTVGYNELHHFQKDFDLNFFMVLDGAKIKLVGLKPWAKSVVIAIFSFMSWKSSYLWTILDPCLLLLQQDKLIFSNWRTREIAILFFIFPLFILNMYMTEYLLLLVILHWVQYSSPSILFFFWICSFHPKLMPTNMYLSRYVATELASDVVINVGDVKFYLHKVRFYLKLRWHCH